jgi:DUF4097 and DUF4098 domain-containing protein YvlB
MRHSSRYLLCFLSFILASMTGCAFAGPSVEGSFERTLSVTGPVDLDITTGSGYIRVRTGGASSVHVHALIRARDDGRMRGEDKVRYLESHPPVEQTGNTIRVGRIDNRDYSQNVSISYDVDVPADTRLHGSTGSGEFLVDGVRGPVEASTGSGNFTGREIQERVRAKTGSGRIELAALKSGAEVSTGSGSIRATSVAGSFKGNTGSGSIILEQSAPGDVEAQTGSGNIELQGVHGALRAGTGSGSISVDGEPASEWKVNTSSGGIEIRLSGSAAFDVYAHTSSGKVTVDHPVTVQGTINPKEIRGKVRGGGPLVEAHTSSGNIRIQ